MVGKVLAGLGTVLAILVIFTISSFIGTNNTCVRFEKNIQAQYGQNQNNYDNFWKRVQEVAQVPKMYSDDLKKVYDSAIQGRYGKEGSKAMFNWIQEHNPTFDASLYKQVQQVVEGGRLAFEADQKTLIDKKREYETYIGVFPQNLMVKVLSYPKIDLAKYDIVTSNETQLAFETKRTGAFQVR